MNFNIKTETSKRIRLFSAVMTLFVGRHGARPLHVAKYLANTIIFSGYDIFCGPARGAAPTRCEISCQHDYFQRL